MANQAGVWIDHKQAILVLLAGSGKLTGSNTELKKIASGINGSDRSVDGAPAKKSYTPNDFIAEDKLERKFDNQVKKFYDQVIAGLQGTKSLLILGPGEAKGEFHKRLTKKVRSLAVAVEKSDKMTDRQLAAKVAQHFAAKPAKAAPPAKKPATRKKPAKKPLKKKAIGKK